MIETLKLLGDRLRSANLKVATAESCTGGGIGQLLTSATGSSEWFEGGVVSYSNEVKERILGVPSEMLAAHGAVSQPVVEQMASGVAELLGVEVSVSVSGVAGPEGGSPEKPVGTVWIGWYCGGKTHSACHHFPGDREQVRNAAVNAAVLGLLTSLEQQFGNRV